MTMHNRFTANNTCTMAQAGSAAVCPASMCSFAAPAMMIIMDAAIMAASIIFVSISISIISIIKIRPKQTNVWNPA